MKNTLFYVKINTVGGVRVEVQGSCHLARIIDFDTEIGNRLVLNMGDSHYTVATFSLHDLV